MEPTMYDRANPPEYVPYVDRSEPPSDERQVPPAQQPFGAASGSSPMTGGDQDCAGMETNVNCAWGAVDGHAEAAQEAEDQEDRLDVLGLAAERVVSFAKDALARRMETLEHADERTGRLEIDSMEEEDERLYRGVLFSCLMLENALRISAPSRHFPRVIGAATDALLADILAAGGEPAGA